MRRCAARVDTSHLDSEPGYLKLEGTALYANFCGGDRDLTMLTVPLVMLVAYGLSSGGGVVSVLRTMERTLWIVVGWVGNFIS